MDYFGVRQMSEAKRRFQVSREHHTPTLEAWLTYDATPWLSATQKLSRKRGWRKSEGSVLGSRLLARNAIVTPSAFVGTDPTKCPQLPSDPSSDRNCGFDVAESLVKC